MTNWIEFLRGQRQAGKTMEEAGALWREAKGDSSKPSVPSPTGSHALDRAPIGSKLVSTEVGLVLAAADGSPARMLPKDDPAAKLPVGAKIAKVGPETYRAEQLNPTDYVAPQHYATTAAAIADFLPRFHHVKADG